LWTWRFHRLIFSIKHLFSGKVLCVLQDTGPCNGSQQFSVPSIGRKGSASQGTNTDVLPKRESLRVAFFRKHTEIF